MGNLFSPRIDNLESNYFPKNGYTIHKHPLEPIARILLIGVYDDNHPLSTFRGMRYIIKDIWEFVIQFNQNYYSKYIRDQETKVGSTYGFKFDTPNSAAFNEITWVRGCHSNPLPAKDLKFPKPLKKEININMMPILMEEGKIKEQLPKQLQGYAEWIHVCLRCDPTQKNTICFLTIHESYVLKGRTQRRPGLHIEWPGSGSNGNTHWTYGWGGGYLQKDGIYIASNISDTCAVWNCRILDDDNEEKTGVVGNMGNLQHLRSMLSPNKRCTLDAHKLYWITDRTPHEVLPMTKSAWRQFFRLVSSKLGVWYEQHSTKNLMGIVPNPSITKIVQGNKFD
eukprot:213405_1